MHTLFGITLVLYTPVKFANLEILLYSARKRLTAMLQGVKSFQRANTTVYKIANFTGLYSSHFTIF